MFQKLSVLQPHTTPCTSLSLERAHGRVSKYSCGDEKQDVCIFRVVIERLSVSKLDANVTASRDSVIVIDNNARKRNALVGGSWKPTPVVSNLEHILSTETR